MSTPYVLCIRVSAVQNGPDILGVVVLRSQLVVDEGPEAFERFRTAMKKLLTVPKSALPPSPFKKWVPKKKKASRSRKVR